MSLNLNGLVCSWRQRARKRGGGKMKDSLAMLLKTNGGKMSVYGSLAMLMKIKGLQVVSRDIDEKKWSYRRTVTMG